MSVAIPRPDPVPMCASYHGCGKPAVGAWLPPHPDDAGPRCSDHAPAEPDDTDGCWHPYAPEEPPPCLRHPDCLLVSEHKGRCEVPTADGATGPAESPASVALRELIERIESGDARAVFVVAVCKDRNLEVAIPGGADVGVALIGLVEVLKARLAVEYIQKSPWSAPQDG